MANGKGLSGDENDRLRAALRELLDRHGWTQIRLAPELGVTQPTLSGVLSGRQGSSYRLATRVAALLGRDVSSILEIAPQGDLAPEASASRVYALATDALGISLEAVRRVQGRLGHRAVELSGSELLDVLRGEDALLRHGLVDTPASSISGSCVIAAPDGSPYPSRYEVARRLEGLVSDRTIKQLTGKMHAHNRLSDPGPGYWLRHAIAIDLSLSPQSVGLQELQELQELQGNEACASIPSGPGPISRGKRERQP